MTERYKNEGKIGLGFERNKNADVYRRGGSIFNEALRDSAKLG